MGPCERIESGWRKVEYQSHCGQTHAWRSPSWLQNKTHPLIFQAKGNWTLVNSSENEAPSRSRCFRRKGQSACAASGENIWIHFSSCTGSRHLITAATGIKLCYVNILFIVHCFEWILRHNPLSILKLSSGKDISEQKNKKTKQDFLHGFSTIPLYVWVGHLHRLFNILGDKFRFYVPNLKLNPAA